MLKSRRLLVMTMILIMVLPQNVWAVKKLAQTGFKWLSIPIGARAIGMGAAVTTMDGDLTTVFWNPAGMAHIEGSGFSFSNVAWIADINHMAASGAYKFSDRLVLSAQVVSVDYGDINGTMRANNASGFIDLGTFSPSGLSAGVGLSSAISNKFSVGGVLKYCYEDLGTAYTSQNLADDEITEVDATLGVPAFDLGTLFYPGYADLRIGMTLANFSQEKSYVAESFPLPLTFRLGTAMDVLAPLNLSSNQKMTVAIDLIHARDYTERIHMGVEYVLNDMISLRTGYKTNYDDENFTLGAGFKHHLGPMAFEFDYAFNNFSTFNPVHMFSFGLSVK
ncbi:MAG: PorV/PorQ family protein [Candidatus Marinimicrobia bacterium]|nr:PorV/PorQ family protein [Candidatus Neomarinimicrobiota bacterium]